MVPTQWKSSSSVEAEVEVDRLLGVPAARADRAPSSVPHCYCLVALPSWTSRSEMEEMDSQPAVMAVTSAGLRQVGCCLPLPVVVVVAASTIRQPPAGMDRSGVMRPEAPEGMVSEQPVVVAVRTGARAVVEQQTTGPPAIPEEVTRPGEPEDPVMPAQVVTEVQATAVVVAVAPKAALALREAAEPEART